MEAEGTIRAMMDELAAAIGRIDPSHLEAIAQIAEVLGEAFECGRSAWVIGNGGSAADAQHIAGELAGRFRRDRRPLSCAALTVDTSVITAIGNDFDFEQVFARQVQALGRAGDVLWALSTSGRSPNILAAARAARAADLRIVAMTGSSGGDLAGLADACFLAPAERTDLIQQLHQAAYHAVCELLDQRFA